MRSRPGWLFEALFLGFVALRSLVRGLDYIRDPNGGSSKVLGQAEEIMPLDSWGWLFILVAALLAAGIVFHARTITVLGCVVGAVAYGSVSWAMTVEVAEMGWLPLRTPMDTVSTTILLSVLTATYIIASRAEVIQQEVSRE